MFVCYGCASDFSKNKYNRRLQNVLALWKEIISELGEHLEAICAESVSLPIRGTSDIAATVNKLDLPSSFETKKDTTTNRLLFLTSKLIKCKR